MELGGASQGLTAAHSAAPFFGVVNEDDGHVMAALQVAQVGEQGGDFAADVFVDPVQTDEGIKNKKAGFQPSDGVVQADAVSIEIEAQAGGGDNLDIERREVDASGGANAVEPATDDVERVFGGVEKDAPGVGDGKVAQAGCAGCDRDGEIQGEERFAALGLAADNADGLLPPEFGDEPALIIGARGETMGELDGKLAHHHRLLAAALVSVGGV